MRTSSRTRSGFSRADQGKHLRAGLGLPDDLEVPVRLERSLDPVEDEAVVVGDYDAHWGAVSHRPCDEPFGCGREAGDSHLR